MRTRFHILLACVAFALRLVLTAGAQAATDPSTPVHLTAAQVTQTLFVAGDPARRCQ
ncbi:MAG TPA: hypothetical protein VIH85_27235 [Solirubrobacteraceae bacterium]